VTRRGERERNLAMILSLPLTLALSGSLGQVKIPRIAFHYTDSSDEALVEVKHLR